MSEHTWQIILALLAGALTSGTLIWAFFRHQTAKIEAEREQEEKNADRVQSELQAEHEAAAQQASEHAAKLEAEHTRALEHAREANEQLRREHESARQEARQAAEETARLLKVEMLEEQQRRRAELEAEIAKREDQLRQREAGLREREAALSENESTLSQREARQKTSTRRLAEEMRRVKRYRDAYRARLRRIAGLTPEQALEAWREEIRTSEDEAIQEIKRDVMLESERAYRQEAQRILIDTMQRITATPPNEISATMVQIPNEDMKGRIIGREGRNIRALESATGVTLMIDETPNSLLVSSFDPVRREIARIALERLIKDGRIHPVSIEETVSQVRDEMKDSVIELGERSLLKLRLHGVHPEIVTLLGKLHYRLSNNQNTLEHSIEVAYFCSLLASELGLDPDIAKRCGLFHDLGKAIDHDYEGSHASSAAMLLKRYGEDDRVVNAVAASHDEVAPESVYAGLLHVADSLSASRPGARANALEGYLQRVRSLEDIARNLPGVSEAYAVQAGREIRVIVEPDRMDDQEARRLARRIRRRIEEELNYPDSIRVTVIREQRFVETAK